MKSISLKAYAKVNLSLDVTGKLENGYHTLRSVMQAVNLFDELIVSIKDVTTSSEQGIELKLDYGDGSSNGGESSNNQGSANDVSGGSREYISTGSDNLACKAAIAMKKHFSSNSCETISISLTKKIPVSAGLAGGSTDAAAVMLALAHLWGLEIGLDKLIEIGKTVGADVPFCLISNAKNNPNCDFSSDKLASSAALAEGIGEKLTPLPSLNGSLIFVKPRLSVSTPVVYALYDEKENIVTNRPNTEILISALTSVSIVAQAFDASCVNQGFDVSSAAQDFDTSSVNQGFDALGGSKDSVHRAENENSKYSYKIIKENIINVLEPIACSEYSQIKVMLDEIKTLIPNEKVFMSGSGPTIVIYFECEEDLKRELINISNNYTGKADIYSMDLLR